MGMDRIVDDDGNHSCNNGFEGTRVRKLAGGEKNHHGLSSLLFGVQEVSEDRSFFVCVNLLFTLMYVGIQGNVTKKVLRQCMGREVWRFGVTRALQQETPHEYE